MFVMNDGEKLYLRNWEYNVCRVMSALQTIVENHGGQVKPVKKPVIENRTLSGAIRDLSEKIERVESGAAGKKLDPERKAAYIARQSAELEKLAAINNDPIQVTQTTYISFVLDDMYYYYSVSDNPFFDFHWRKTPVVNGKVSQNAACNECKKEWVFDCFFSFQASNADCVEAANIIFNMLMNAKNSRIIRDGRRQRVQNTYNSGYHYETIYTPERWENYGSRPIYRPGSGRKTNIQNYMEG